MAKSGDLSVGMFVKHNGELMQIIEYQHRTPGNLRAFYQAKMRNVKSGKLAETRYRADEEVETVRIEIRELQYLYEESDNLVCMDNDTFDQIDVEKSLFGDGIKFMKEGMIVQLSFQDENVIAAAPPNFVELEITYTEPGIKGDTATNTLKPATLETGASIMVPLFCNIGEKIRIDTRTQEYMERVK